MRLAYAYNTLGEPVQAVDRNAATTTLCLAHVIHPCVPCLVRDVHIFLRIRRQAKHFDHIVQSSRVQITEVVRYEG